MKTPIAIVAITTFQNIVPGKSLSDTYPHYMCFAAPSHEKTGQSAKADAALQYAPNWKRLKEAREAAAKAVR